MANPFSHTLRALAGDRLRGPALALAASAALFALWAAWFFLARVEVLETTRAARLEVAAEPHPVEAAVGGAVVSARLAAGDEVRAGDVLVELDATLPRLELDEAKAKLDALAAHLAAVTEVAAGPGARLGDEGLRRERARIEGEMAAGRAACARLEHEIARHHIVAPAAGRLASVQTIVPGMVVRAGDRLATVFPSGDLKIVAELGPEQALGKLRPGQRARMRLDGFPW